MERDKGKIGRMAMAPFAGATAFSAIALAALIWAGTPRAAVLAVAASYIVWMVLAYRATGREAARVSADDPPNRFAGRIMDADERVRDLLERSTLGIQLGNGQGKRLFVNQALADLMGYDSAAEILAAKPAALVASEDVPRLMEISAHHFTGEGAPTTYEFIGIRKDGSRIPVQVVTSLLTWEGETAIQRTFIDLTARKKAEEALRISEANLSAAQRLTGVGSWESDLQINKTRYSSELCRILNVDPEVGTLCYEEYLKRVHPDDRDAVDRRNKHARKTGELINHQYRIVQCDGTVRHVHSMAEVFFDHLGQPVRVTGALQDITDRVLAEQALRESEANLAEAQRIARVGSWVNDRRSGKIQFSDELNRMLGIDPETYAYTPDSFMELVHPDDRERVLALREELRSGQGDKDIVFRIVRPNGEVRHIHSREKAFFGVNGELLRIAGTCQDITEQVRAEEALRASELRFSLMLDVTPEAVIAIDGDQRIEMFNKAAEEMFGYSAEEMVGQPLDVLLPAQLKNRHRKFIDRFAATSETSRLMSRRGELVGVRKDGTEFPAAASISKLELGGEMIFTAIFHDISNRKSAEMAMIAATREAMVANRAKSEFLANMSHEFRTPLNAIIGFAEIMMDEMFGPLGNPRYREYMGDICYSARHLRDLITDILDLSKVESGMDELLEESIDVVAVVHAIRRLLQQRADEQGIELILDLDGDLPLLWADPRKLKQILVNLLSNAVKFTTPGGKVTVRAWCKRASGHVFQVVDTGIGISQQDIPRVLKQFGQVDDALNRHGEGTGLGLPLTKSLIELHGGSLDMQSEIGQGTTVTVRFPAQRIVDAAGHGSGGTVADKAAG